MNTTKLKRIYALHSWLALISGLFIFTVCLTGTIALFGKEIKTWVTPELRQAYTQTNAKVNIQDPFEKAIQAVPSSATITNVGILLPSEKKPYIETFISYSSKQEGQETLRQQWQINTGKLLPKTGEDTAQWFINFHRFFMIPNTQAGLALVGFFGILMLILIITGLLMHRNIVSDLFKWHLVKKSLRTRFRTTHNLLAVWGIPFHIMIAFTGAFLGIVSILTPISGLIIFEGDKTALVKALGQEPVKPSGIYAPMYPLELAKQKVEEATNKKVRMILISNWEDTHAHYELFFVTPSTLSTSSHARINATSGEIIDMVVQENTATSFNVINSMAPLHYGNYGGVWLKFLYAFLGIVSSMLVATGLALWLEKRRNNSKRPLSSLNFRLLEGTFIGVTLGLLVASIGVLYVDRLWEFPVEERLYYIGLSYFILWGLSLLYALISINRRQVNKHLLGLSGLGFLGLGLLDWSLTRDSILTLLSQNYFYAAGVNIFGFLFGLILLLIVFRFPKRSHLKEA